MHQIFISYRRSDTSLQAHALKATIQSMLPGTFVFVDISTINPGDRWEDRLLHALNSAAVAVFLIGPDWRMQGTRDRLADPEDWVRKEIVHALSSKEDQLLLPVLCQSTWSDHGTLPDEIASITAVQCLTLEASSWLKDVETISQAIGAHIQRTLSNNPIYPRHSGLSAKQMQPGLSDEDIAKLMVAPDLEGWHVAHTIIALPDKTIAGRELRKGFVFKSFRRAFAFIQKVSEEAERRKHHPVLHHAWGTVHMFQRTWDNGHVLTPTDFEVAEFATRTAKKVAALSVQELPFS